MVQDKDGNTRPCRLLGRNTTLNSKNIYNEPYHSVVNRFESLKKRMLTRCPDLVKEINVVYECTFETDLITPGNPVYKFYHADQNLVKNIQKPKKFAYRDALRGGYVTNFSMYLQSDQDNVVEFRDENSLYPQIAQSRSFVTGPPCI